MSPTPPSKVPSMRPSSRSPSSLSRARAASTSSGKNCGGAIGNTGGGPSSRDTASPSGLTTIKSSQSARSNPKSVNTSLPAASSPRRYLRNNANSDMTAVLAISAAVGRKISGRTRGSCAPCGSNVTALPSGPMTTRSFHLSRSKPASANEGGRFEPNSRRKYPRT